MEWDVLEGMEEEYSQNDGEESTDRSNDSVCSHTQPLFEEDGRASHDGCREEDVVDWGDDGGVEDVEGSVQVINLNANTDDQADDQGPEEGFLQHRCPRKQLFDANAQPLHARHGE